jgi:hypothetical protein
VKVVVEGCGQVGRGRRGGQRAALSTASRPVRAQLGLSACPQPGAAEFSRSVRQTCYPSEALELVMEHSVNALTRLVQPCSPNSCQS